MIKPFPIIGIAGKAGSGKTWAADYLANTYNGTNIALADPIKELLFQIGASEEALWGPSEMRSYKADLVLQDTNNVLDQCKDLCERIDIDDSYTPFQLAAFYMSKLDKATIRDCLKVIGSWGRGTNPDLWINYGKKVALQDLSLNKDFAIISDLRFRNEILGVREIGGLVIKIEGNNPDTGYHVSETELDTCPKHFFTHIIKNTYNPYEMGAELDAIIQDCYNDGYRLR